MIRRLFIDNYKCLVNFELELSEVTLLLGRNGVGKSAVLDVLFALRGLLTGHLKISDRDAFPTSTLTRWQTREIQAVEIETLIASQPIKYRIEIEHDRDKERSRIVLEKLESATGPLFEFAAGEVQLYRDNHSPGPTFGSDWSESALARVAERNDNRTLSEFLKFIRKMVVCGPIPPLFRAEARTEDPILMRDASNFAAWYRHFTLERQDLSVELTQELKNVLEGFRGLRLEQVGTDTRALKVMFAQDKDRYELSLDEVSDGQRALIVLYSFIHLTAGHGHALFLDEPDNFVALQEIQPWLRSLFDACGDMIPQALICSHHPGQIDYLGVDCGVMLTREPTGVTSVRRVKDQDLTVEGGLKLSEVIARGWEK